MKTSKLLVFFVFLFIQVKAQDTENLDIQVNKFARNIEVSINNGNPAFLNGSINYEILFNTLIDKQGAASNLNDRFFQEMKFNYGLGTIIEDELGNSGMIELLNCSKETNSYHLLYRTFSSSGINYFELITSVISNKIFITDAYIYKSSLYYSVHLKNLYSTHIARFTDSDNCSINSFAKQKAFSFEKINRLIALKEYKKAYEEWKALPNRTRIEKHILVKAIEASSYFSTSITQELISSFISLYGNCNKFYLIPLEGFYQQNEYQHALNSIDSLSVAVFDDPFLNLYRGVIYSEMKNIHRAEWYYKEFITKKPDVSTGYFSLLDLYLSNNKYASATELLNQLSVRFGYYKHDLLNLLLEYPDFLNSEMYNSWIKE